MTSAAISKLKASLSEYLNRVKAGEEVLVTDRGKAIAKIVPISPKTYMPDHLKNLERRGLVKLGEGKIPKDFWEMPRPRDSKGLALKALLDEREEGE